MLDIFPKTVTTAKDGAGLNPIEGQEFAPNEFAPKDRADRALHVLKGRNVAKDEEQDARKQRFKADPQEQILELYDEYRPRLFRYIHSMSLDRDQAEDVIQETFMRLTTELLRDKHIENVQGWIVRVAHNLAVDVFKKHDRSAAGAVDNTIALVNHADPASGPEETYLKKEQIRCMELALATFNLQQRHCFHMRVQGFRFKDIGQALGISEQRAAFILKEVAVRLAAICG